MCHRVIAAPFWPRASISAKTLRQSKFSKKSPSQTGTKGSTGHTVLFFYPSWFSNNDWKVSHRIIGRADVSLQQVTDVFEEHYGKLKSLEWAMIHPSLIVAIASKYAVGIITGRPRRDAEEFLERFGIRSVFRR